VIVGFDGSTLPSEGIQGADNPQGAFVEHVGVDHRGFDLRVAKKLLHGADVLACLQKMGGETMTEGVRRYMGRDAPLVGGPFHCTLQADFMQVMSPAGAAARVHRIVVAHKHKLPLPLIGRVGVFSGQCARKLDFVHPLFPILFVLEPASVQVLLKLGFEGARKGHPPILIALAASHHDLAPVKGEVLDPEAQRLRYAHTRAVHQTGEKALLTVDSRQEGLRFLAAQHHGKALGKPGSRKVGEVSRLLFNDLPVKEHNRIESLVLGAARHPLVDGQMAEKLVDLRPTHIRRSFAVMIGNEPPNPMHIRPLGFERIVLRAQGFAHRLFQCGRVSPGRRLVPYGRGEGRWLLDYARGGHRSSGAWSFHRCASARLPLLCVGRWHRFGWFRAPRVLDLSGRFTLVRGRLYSLGQHGRLRFAGPLLPAIALRGTCPLKLGLGFSNAGGGASNIEGYPTELLVIYLQCIPCLEDLPGCDARAGFKELDECLDFQSPQIPAPFTLLMPIEELPHPMRIKGPACLLEAQLIEDIEIPLGPSRARIVRCNASALSLVVIVHILHPLRVCYWQYPTGTITHRASTTQAVFTGSHLLVFVPQYLAVTMSPVC